MRQEAGLSPSRRRLLQIERDRLLASLEELDRLADERAVTRHDLVKRLGHLRDTLWPPLPGCRARRPPLHDQPGLPPIAAGAVFLAGRPLRAACRAILHRRGPIALTDLHAALHLSGYAVASPRPVQALADAMGYEAEQGRAQRVARGVYGPAGRAPATTIPDPVVGESPGWLPPPHTHDEGAGVGEDEDEDAGEDGDGRQSPGHGVGGGWPAHPAASAPGGTRSSRFEPDRAEWRACTLVRTARSGGTSWWAMPCCRRRSTTSGAGGTRGSPPKASAAPPAPPPASPTRR